MGKFEPKHSEEKQREICQEIIELVCIENYNIPNACKVFDIAENTFKRYLWKHQDLLDVYTRAREFQSNFFEEEIKRISEDTSEDKQYVKGDSVGNAVAVQRANLKIGTLQWLAKVRNRERYGDKQDLTTKGKEIQAQNIINLGEGKKPE